MRVNLVFFLKSGMIPGYYREFTEVYEISTSTELETIYKKAAKWCNTENSRGILAGQDDKRPKWDWLVRYGEDEKNINPMLLLQLIEVVEDVMKYWDKNGGQAKKYEA